MRRRVRCANSMEQAVVKQANAIVVQRIREALRTNLCAHLESLGGGEKKPVTGLAAISRPRAVHKSEIHCVQTAVRATVLNLRGSSEDAVKGSLVRFPVEPDTSTGSQVCAQRRKKGWIHLDHIEAAR